MPCIRHGACQTGFVTQTIPQFIENEAIIIERFAGGGKKNEAA